MHKMVNGMVPEYLNELVPKRVGAQVDYNLRNGNNLAIPKTKHVKTYNSSVPKTIRDWNNIGSIKNSITCEGFKTRYKRDILKKPNPIFNIDHSTGLHQKGRVSQ